MRVFISYRDRPPDRHVAAIVYEALKGEHEIFFAPEITKGRNWAQEVDEGLAQADCLIAFLSAESVASGNVVGEIERAHKLGKAIIPVRVAFTGALPYPLNGMLDHIQECRWKIQADTPRLLKELKDALKQLPDLPSDAAFRQKYLDSVIRQHRYIQFSGMAEVSGQPEVEIARVFVMPRVTEQEKDARPAAAHRLISAKRAVVLGGPGSGKTTLLEAFALALSGASKFDWTKKLPKLLPVFYRVRDMAGDT